MALAILAAAYAVQARFESMHQWRAEPDTYFADGVPVMTTADAYYSLRLAAARHDGTFAEHVDDPLRRYERLQRPREASEYFTSDIPLDWAPQRTPRRMPLLAELIAAAIPAAGSAELAGLYLTPVLASLFMIPLYLYAWKLGEPAAGLLAALTGAFAPVYLARTQLGFVDTDCLNLFFPWLASLLVFSADRTARTTRLVVTSATLGFVLYLYFRWYEKAAISALYWGTLALWLAVQRRRPREIALALIVCVLCSHPVQLAMCVDNAANLLGRYWGRHAATDGMSVVDSMFPNVMETVGEQRGPKGVVAVGAVLGPWMPAALGLLGIAVLAIRRWRDCIPLGPIVVMGAFTYVSGSRFAMYLAPLVGLGLGFLITIVMRRIAARVTGGAGGQRGAGSRESAMESMAACLIVAFVFFAWLRPSMARAVPSTLPTIPGQEILAIRHAAASMPPGARAWTWWDRGFAYSHLAGWTVYHDGSAQYTPQTHVIAYSLATDSQSALHAAMARVDRIGNQGITATAGQVHDREALLRVLSEPDGVPRTDAEQFVVFSRDMLPSAAAQRHVAGLPIRTPDGVPITFRPLPCSAFRDDRLECGQDSVNLATGRFDHGTRVRRLDIVDGGTVTKRVDYANPPGLVLEIVIGRDRQIEVFLLPDELYRSNLNRMFLLGEYDRSLFEEVHREVPRLRVFRRLASGAAGG